MIRWSFFWTLITSLITGLFTYQIANGNIQVWQGYLRYVGGLFFFMALLAGGVFTTRVKDHRFCREDWSFICILVTISLFGISFLF